MASSGHQSSNSTDSIPMEPKHVHHGRTPAAWVGSMVAMAAFVIGGVAVVLQVWPLFWASVALLVVGLVATKVLQVTGHGAR